jgi:hypothetical protein
VDKGYSHLHHLAFDVVDIGQMRVALDHLGRHGRWLDNRYSSNTWGPLPPRSYFRFDDAAVASERESLEMLGRPLPEEVNA